MVRRGFSDPHDLLHIVDHIANGVEMNFSGVDEDDWQRAFYSTQNSGAAPGSAITVTVLYARAVNARMSRVRWVPWAAVLRCPCLLPTEEHGQASTPAHGTRTGPFAHRPRGTRKGAEPGILTPPR